MVCIAAFIVLAIIGVFVAAISIFRPKVGKAYLKLLKKSAGCLGKKVRLQKCETGFKDDVKNTLLSRVVIRHPKWLKPLSVVIEALAVVIVVVFVWAVVTAIKSLLALAVLGTCNVTKAESCALGAEVCSIDESEPDGFFEGIGRWFTEWGEIFEAIPDKFREYRGEDYDFSYIVGESSGDTSDSNEDSNEGSNDDTSDGDGSSNEDGDGDSSDSKKTDDDAAKPIAVEILDPGCIVCAKSYKAQKTAGFAKNYTLRIVPFAIQGADDTYKFKNSEILVRYILAAEEYQRGLGIIILEHVFYDKNEDGIAYQDLMNEDFSREEAVQAVNEWLREAGVHSTEREKIRETAMSEEITAKMQKNREIVENQIRVKGIPTMIYDGARHTGLWKM